MFALFNRAMSTRSDCFVLLVLLWQAIGWPLRVSARNSPILAAALLLGASTMTQQGALAFVPLSSGVGIIAGGGAHTCTLTVTGGVKCWGSNSSGQLGNGAITESTTAVDVIDLSRGVKAIAAGHSHTCALTAGGGVKCWGYNQYGALGNGSKIDSSTAVDVSGLASGITGIAAGIDYTCALTAAGGVKCWGYNYFGQLGNGSTTDSTTAVDVSGLASGVKAIAAGGSHACALTADGGVKCWGSNNSGQLGNGNTTNSTSAVDVSGLTSDVKAIAAGHSQTCALTVGGGVKCWGFNSSGQLGNGSATDSSTAVDVNGLTGGVMAIAAGGSHTCALTAGGGAKCWGFNRSGQLGNRATADSTIAVDVSGLTSGVTAIATGGRHTCALTATGGAKCWGLNDSGQLGNGTTNASSIAVEVSGITPASVKRTRRVQKP